MNNSMPGGSASPVRSKMDSFSRFLGVAIVEWQPDYAVLELEIDRETHVNRSGILHGGVLMTLIDTACGYAGTYCDVPGEVRRASTLSLTTSFVAPVSGGKVRAVGHRKGGGRKIFFASAEVFSEGGVLLGFGEGSFRYRGDSAGSRRAPD